MSQVNNLAKQFSDTLQKDLRTLTVWDPIGNRVQCAFRDAAYFVIDIPRFLLFTNSNYGAMRRYLRQSRLNKGKVNPEDFRDVDTNVLRESLIRHSQIKGPLQKVDFRFFYWVYIFLMAYVLLQGRQLLRMKEEREDRSGATLAQRRQMYDDDYIEELRRQ